MSDRKAENFVLTIMSKGGKINNSKSIFLINPKNITKSNFENK